MFRSQVKHIHLAAIAKVEHLKKYGCNAILKPIVEDIKKLVSKLIMNQYYWCVTFSYRKLDIHL